MPKRICSNGHSYFKTSDCPVCPICENNRKPIIGLLAKLAAPARRALENKGISNVEQLSLYSKKEILALHGLGPSSIPILEDALKFQGLNFK